VIEFPLANRYWVLESLVQYVMSELPSSFLEECFVISLNVLFHLKYISIIRVQHFHAVLIVSLLLLGT
jgi:hypothetical protein